MILDVTHLSDQCFDEALEIYGGPVLASHHNNRSLVPDQRQLTDEQTKRLIARGAVIGMAMVFNFFCAGMFGFAIPVLLNKFGADPAIASSVFLTTVTDVVGFFAFLGLATILLL